MAQGEKDAGTVQPGALRLTANDQFKRTFGPWLWGSIMLATVLHFGMFAFFRSANSVFRLERTARAIGGIRFHHHLLSKGKSADKVRRLSGL